MSKVKSDIRGHFVFRVHENSANYSAFDDPLIDPELAELLAQNQQELDTVDELSEQQEESPQHEAKKAVGKEGAPDTQAG